MTSRSKHSPRAVAVQTQGSQSRIPRTMPVTVPESMDFSATTMADLPNPNFSLTSSCSGIRRLHSSNSDLVSCDPYPGTGSDDFFLSTTPAMTYASMSSGNTYPGPLLPTMSSYDLDSTSYDFLVDNVVSSNSSMDMSFVSLPYHGHGQSQDILTSYVDVSMCNPAMMNNCFGQEGLTWSPTTRPDTPPPEHLIQEFLPQHFSSAQDLQDDTCQGDQDLAIYEANDISKSSSLRSDWCDPVAVVCTDLYLSSSASRRNVTQPRPIRSASERSDSSTDHNVAVEPRTIKDDQVDKVKARSHPLYDAKVQEDGKYHCPMKETSGCNHAPTGQKCIYNKYLDSHLRPYRCKYADRGDCDETRFSSNACLFRHEREAHGLHNHGVNPFLCKFADCDRAREGNGFPRRWNQRDHMKRVHDYIEADCTKDRSTASEPTKRRKGSGVPTSTPMKRSTSSAQAKAQAMAGAAIPKYYGRVNQARYAAPRMYSGQVEYSAASRQVSLDDVQFSSPATISRVSRDSQHYARLYAS